MTVIYACEICGEYHPWGWNGDCRDDNNRYPSPEEYAVGNALNEDEIEIRSMAERVAADLAGE